MRRVSHPPWPQRFERSEELLGKLKVMIVRIVAKEAITKKVNRKADRYDSAARGGMVKLYGWETTRLCPYSHRGRDMYR